MKTLKFKETGAEIQVQDIDAKDLLKGGEYEEVEIVIPLHARPVTDRVDQLERELAASRETIAALQAKVDELEAEGPGVDELETRIAALQAKKDAGTMARNEHALLALLLKKKSALEAEA